LLQQERDVGWTKFPLLDSRRPAVDSYAGVRAFASYEIDGHVMIVLPAEVP
jgi:hypothetical protein